MQSDNPKDMTPPACKHMQLGRARLFPSERHCRVQAKLCIYFGQRPNEQAHQWKRGLWWAILPPSPLAASHARIQLNAFLLWNQDSLLLLSLVDSGADDNFIDSPLVMQAGIPTKEVPIPNDINTLDGKLLAHVTHWTVPITLLLSGNHSETIQWNVIPSPHSPVGGGLTLAKTTQSPYWLGYKFHRYLDYFLPFSLFKILINSQFTSMCLPSRETRPVFSPGWVSWFRRGI